MLIRLLKLAAALTAVALLALLLGGVGVTPISADAPHFAPPTVVLPTPVATKPAPRVAPTALKTAPTQAPVPAARSSVRGSTTKLLSTNFTLVNLDAVADANVQVQFKKPDGSTWLADTANISFTVPHNGGQKIVRQYSPFESTMTPGTGSAVISSNTQLGSVVQVIARNQIATSGAYIGFTSPSDKYYIPLVMRQRSTQSGLTNSQIIIQNADVSPVANVQVSLSGTASYVKTIASIAGGASYVYDLADESAVNLPDNFQGSAVVNGGASSQLAVIVNTFTGPDQLQTYNAFNAASPTTAWFVPLFASRLANGLSTPIAIQNLSGGQLAIGAVQANCTPDAGSGLSAFPMSNTVAINNNEAYYFNPVIDMTIPGTWQGSCKVTSSGGNIVVYSQLRLIGTWNSDAYQAINANGTNRHVMVPMAAKRLAVGFATAITIQNLGTGTAHVTLTYTPSPDYVAQGGSAAVLSRTTTIGPNDHLIENQRLAGFSVGGSAMPDGWFGTLQVTSSDEYIDGFVQLTNWLGAPGDNLMTHNVFTSP